MPRTDLPASIGLIVLGLWVLRESWRMPRFERIGGTVYSAPGLVPGILAVVLTLLGVVMLSRFLWSRRPAAAPATAAAQAAADHGEDAEPAAAPSLSRLVGTLGLTVVFAVGLVGRMPFWLATFLFVFTYVVVFERSSYTDRARTLRGLAFAAGIAAATGFAVPFVFERVFLVNLP